MRPNGHRDAVRADRSAVDPVYVVLHAGVVDEVASGEVVSAVDNDITVSSRRSMFEWLTSSDVRLDFYFGIDLPQVIGGGDGFRQTLFSVTLREHRLPLQI